MGKGMYASREEALALVDRLGAAALFTAQQATLRGFEVVRKLMNHQSLAVTQRYFEATEDEARAAVDLL